LTASRPFETGTGIRSARDENLRQVNAAVFAPRNSDGGMGENPPQDIIAMSGRVHPLIDGQ
jgi:hypothetical protein